MTSQTTVAYPVNSTYCRDHNTIGEHDCSARYLSIAEAASRLGVKPWDVVRLIGDQRVAAVQMVDADSLARYAKEWLVAPCPAWCVDDHRTDDPCEDGRLHTGPTFGRLRAWGYEYPDERGMQLRVELDDGGDGGDLKAVQELRDLAADAARAAAWMASA